MACCWLSTAARLLACDDPNKRFKLAAKLADSMPPPPPIALKADLRSTLADFMPPVLLVLGKLDGVDTPPLGLEEDGGSADRLRLGGGAELAPGKVGGARLRPLVKLA